MFATMDITEMIKQIKEGYSKLQTNVKLVMLSQIRNVTLATPTVRQQSVMLELDAQNAILDFGFKIKTAQLAMPTVMLESVTQIKDVPSAKLDLLLMLELAKLQSPVPTPTVRLAQIKTRVPNAKPISG